MSFDGIDNFVSVPDANSLDWTSGFTLSAWVMPANIYTDYRAVVVKNNEVQRLYGSSSGGQFCGDGAVLGLMLRNDGFYSGDQFDVCDTTPLAINVWTHLALTYDGSNLKLYKNGVLIQTTGATGIMAPTTGSLQIGASRFGEYWDGRIDEVRVYNYAIPISAGSNTVPGAACVFGDPLNTAQQGVIRDMNCPVIGGTPPLVIKFPASATALKLGASATGLKFGTQ